jgi:hypothetical protein
MFPMPSYSRIMRARAAVRRGRGGEGVYAEKEASWTVVVGIAIFGLYT